MSAKSRDSADSLDSEIVFDLSDEVKLRWIQFISVKLTVAPTPGKGFTRSFPLGLVLIAGIINKASAGRPHCGWVLAP